MQELPVSDLTVPKLLAAVARGESVRLLDNGQEVAVVVPPDRQVDNPAEAARKPFGAWVKEWREKYEIDKYGLTDEEIAAMRDRSPGPEPLDFSQ